MVTEEEEEEEVPVVTLWSFILADESIFIYRPQRDASHGCKCMADTTPTEGRA